MALRITNLRLGVDTDETELPARLARVLSVPLADLGVWRILRKSLDARDSDDLSFVYSLEVTTPEERFDEIAQKRGGMIRVEPWEEEKFFMPVQGNSPLPHRPVIIGSGPAGMGAAYFLSQLGYQPLVLERGAPVSERIRDVKAFDEGGEHNQESNYLFGEGGAGTFSDGKLTCRMSGPDVRQILEMYAACKGKPSILYDHRPHLGSNRLPAVVKAQRQRIEAMGGEIRFHTRMEKLDIQEGTIRGVQTSSGYIPASIVILAIGHSARDSYTMLHECGVAMEHKPFQIGVRIEHPQENTNRQTYGPKALEAKLGSASFSVIQKTSQLDVFSFCMCAGGYVMPSVSDPNYFCTNGMSLSKRDSPYANSGLVVTLESKYFPSSHPLAGMHVQQQYEAAAYQVGKGNYDCPIQWGHDFLAGRKSSGNLPSSYPRKTISTQLGEVLPPVITKSLMDALPAVDRRWRGKFLQSATLVGPESRGSAPVRIPRNDVTRECSNVAGLYPVGEGAGYAGGIVSAAVDGLRTAKAVIVKYRQPG